MPDNEIPVITGFSKSASIGELTKALALAHKDFKPVLKDANNPFFKSKYADLAGVIEATSDALSKQELVVIQSPGRIYNGHILLTTLLSHSSGEWVKDELELPIAKFDAQGTGSAITYARRYAYQAIVGVAAEDDDGNSASGKFEKQPDGNFVRKTDNVTNVPSLPQPPVVGKLPETKPARKKKDVPDAGKPWNGEFEPKTATTPGSPEANIHGVVIEDSEIEFPGDVGEKAPNGDLGGNAPEVARLTTDAERTAFQKRLIALRDKGFDGTALRAYLMKESGIPKIAASQEIPYAKFAELVDRLEKAEVAGNLKELLG